MEMLPIAGMLFSLLLVGMIAGFILLFPISRRMGALLEQKVKGKLDDEGAMEEVKRLEATVRALQEEVERLVDRQAFTDSLLAEREPLLLRDRSETNAKPPS
jgi:hypothetical protein